MVVFKTVAVGAAVLVSMSAGAATPASHSQFHGRYSDASHYRTAKVQNDQVQSDKGLPRSTVAPSVTPAATAGSARTHVSEIDRLERQSSLQLAAERKQEARTAGISNIARSEASGRASSINFSYHSPQRAQTWRSSGSGGRRP
jgi:hypothetical protein